MKKILLYTCILNLLCACSSFDEPVQSLDDNTCKESMTDKTDKAVKLALHARSEFYGAESRHTETLAVSSVNYITGKESRDAQIDTLLYIVNFDDSKGYAVVCANETGEKLLAVTDRGCIENVDSISIPGLKAFMAEAIEYAEKNASKGPNKARIETKTIIDTLENVNVKPRVSVEWGQRGYMGYLCPNGISGCVVTAAVQALSYIEYPSTLTLSYPERTTNMCLIDWGDLKSGLKQYQLAYLGRELGYRMNASYGTDGTAIKLSKARDVLKSMLNGKASVSQIYSKIPDAYHEIEDNGVIIMGGLNVDKDGKKTGHCWIIDGFRHMSIKVQIIQYPYGTIGLEEILETHIERTDYNHVNWGYFGVSNGYFLKDVFDISKAESFDNSEQAAGQNYTEDLNYIVIKPL